MEKLPQGKPAEPIRVCLIGGGGQIGYSLIPMIASGEVFGRHQRVEIRIQDIAQKQEHMAGICMELEDCRYPLLKSIQFGTEVNKLVDKADYIVMLASMPMSIGEERFDLLKKNIKLIMDMGKIIDDYAPATTKIVMVTNPANTMSWALSRMLKKIPKENITGLSMLDHNRTLSQVSKKANVDPSTVRNIICWGNHSRTIYPDVTYATIMGRPVRSVILEEAFFKAGLLDAVRSRAFEVQKARGQTAGFSTASAVRDHLKCLYCGTPENEWVSMVVYTGGKANHYEVDNDLYFSFPVVCEKAKYEILAGFKWDDFAKTQITATLKELLEERDVAKAEIEKLFVPEKTVLTESFF